MKSPRRLGEMMRRALFVLATTVIAIVLSTAPAMANNLWNGYHWADSGGDDHDGAISIDLVDDLTEYSTQYPLVVSDWDGAPGPLSLSSSKGAPADRPIACNNDSSEAAATSVSGTIHVCNDAYGQNGWLGLARIWLTAEGHIEGGVALMNDSYFLVEGSTYNNPTAWQHVLCQEVGHAFGLGHQGSPKKQSCMNDRWGLTSTNFVSPNQHDFDMLNELYGGATDGGDGGGSGKPCNPKSPKCSAGNANVQIVARAGGGWVVTFTTPPGLARR